MSRFDNVVIRASAGTGKTYQLSNRFLGLLADGAPIDQILATTFTRKAAGEILDRVVMRLALAAGSDAGAEQLAAALETPDLSRGRCVALLRQVLRNLHRLRICTLDSFFSQIASSFSLELSLPPGWRIVEELEDEQLRAQATEQILRGDADNDIVRLMHLVTKGEAERSIGELVKNTVRSLYQLYAETREGAWRQFPRLRPLAEEELETAILELDSAPLPQDQRFLEAHEKDLESARRGDWEAMVQSGLTRRILEGGDKYYNKPIPTEAIAAYIRVIDHIRGVLIGQLASQTAATYRLLHRFDGAYTRLKNATLAMRFDDVTRRLAEAASSEQVDRLEFRLDAPITHLLLDEFQDTSLPQWQALRPFAERVTGAGGKRAELWQGGRPSFFCVGDIKQAIYGWRGGRSEIFQALEAHLDHLEHQSLNESFRSAQPIIDAVNRVFSNLHQHPKLDDLEQPVRLWAEAFREHTTARSDLPGFVQVEMTPRDNSDGSNGNGRRRDLHLRRVAERIQELVRQAPGRSIGVLARRNSVVARLIYLLRKLGVEASEEGGSPLTDSAAVQLVLALLHLADHPGDTVSRFHIAKSPFGKALGYTSHMSNEGADRLAQLIRRQLMDDGLGPTMMRWFELLGPVCGPRDHARMEQLVRLAYYFQNRATLRTTEFIQYVETQRIASPSASANVRVMTVHQAKGLQFDLVVLPDLENSLVGQPDACVVGQADSTEPPDRVCLYRNKGIQSLLPDELRDLFSRTTQQKVHEALCVLYVALTRPVHALHVMLEPSSPREMSVPKTFAGLLRATLAEGRGEPDAVLYAHGDAHWHAAAPVDELAPKLPAPLPHRIRLAPMKEGRRAGLQRSAPSSLEGGQQIRLGSILRLDNAAALARGTMIHAWFEQIAWLDDGLPSPEALRRIAAGFEGSGLNIDETLRQFHRMLQLPQIAGALSREAYHAERGPFLRPEFRNRLRDPRLEVQNERRFAVRDDHRMLSGTIDRLVLIYDGDRVVGADVIDFKTDAVSTDDPETLNATVEHYRPQQEAYRSAVAKMFKLEPEKISTRLLLLAAGIVKDL
ncbi:MAG: UvrD-helicase domain-containing protein [Planctomycetales bacterium]|nr:UvrD-helicase domain-containing protein [Planctomycetales bacterium]